MAAKKHEPITNLGWFFLITFTVLVDIVQAVLNFAFGAGVLVNRIIDVGFAFSLLLIFYLKGVPLTPAQYGSICAAFIGEEIPALDTLPMWTLDVVYIFASIKGQEVFEKMGVAGKVLDMAMKASKKAGGGNVGGTSTPENLPIPAAAPEHLPTNTVDLRPSAKA